MQPPAVVEHLDELNTACRTCARVTHDWRSMSSASRVAKLSATALPQQWRNSVAECWVPLSGWKIRPGPGRRESRAIRKPSQTRTARMRSEIAQPTTHRHPGAGPPRRALRSHPTAAATARPSTESPFTGTSVATPIVIPAGPARAHHRGRRRRFGISTLTCLRLFTRAWCTRIRSWLSAGCSAGRLRVDVPAPPADETPQPSRSR